MAEAVVLLTMGEPDPPLLRHPAAAGRVRAVDCYRLTRAVMHGARALLVGMHADQRHLAASRTTVEGFVRSGGRLVVCGQVALPFLTGLSPFRPLAAPGLDDLAVHRVGTHSVWAGVEPADLTLRRGVAGFYGRGWHRPPRAATVVHALGRGRHPLDFVYRLGRGEVLLHGGNDLWSWDDGPGTTARLVPQLLGWAGG